MVRRLLKICATPPGELADRPPYFFYAAALLARARAVMSTLGHLPGDAPCGRTAAAWRNRSIVRRRQNEAHVERTSSPLSTALTGFMHSSICPELP